MGGWHNAFSPYECGDAAPVPAVMTLLRILDRHPDRLKELTGSQSVGGPGDVSLPEGIATSQVFAGGLNYCAGALDSVEDQPDGP